MSLKDELEAAVASPQAHVAESALSMWLQKRGSFFIHNFFDVVIWMLAAFAAGYLYGHFF